MNKDIITVTSPLLPNLGEFTEILKDIWNSKWITNNGSYHQKLEQALAEYLKSAIRKSFYEWYFAIDNSFASFANHRRGNHNPV